MIIQSAAILAKLLEKNLSNAQDSSRHYLCPSCTYRTKLYSLKDGRKKCSECGRKFDPYKKTDQTKLKQYADILACFCLDFPAQQTVNVTRIRYRLVAENYKHFRILLAQQSLSQEQMHLLVTVNNAYHSCSESIVLKNAKIDQHHKNTKKGDAPIFGIKYLKNGKVFIDVINDEAVPFHFEALFNNIETKDVGRFNGYCGFIRGRKFLRFSDTATGSEGAENLWEWINVRMLRHHGIWKKNTGLYLKELEWKYNHRLLTSEAQALAIVDLIPPDFLKQWSTTERRETKSVQ